MQADLAALVGSRICHDLISPIGAISNGVELMSLTDNTAGEEMALIQQSVNSAAARIKFFRIAYGAATEGQTTQRAEIKVILDGLSEGGRVAYDWQLEDGQDRPLVRCIFLLLQAVETALPLGGQITVSARGTTIVIAATGRRIAFDPTQWDGLNRLSESVAHTAASVQFALLPDIIGALDRTLRTAATDTTLRVEI
jgi:histidine phosphotransferase ChpT